MAFAVTFLLFSCHCCTIRNNLVVCRHFIFPMSIFQRHVACRNLQGPTNKLTCNSRLLFQPCTASRFGWVRVVLATLYHLIFSCLITVTLKSWLDYCTFGWQGSWPVCVSSWMESFYKELKQHLWQSCCVHYPWPRYNVDVKMFKLSNVYVHELCILLTKKGI